MAHKSVDKDTRWFVVQTRVNQEAKAARNLVQQGYQIYMPQYRKRRRHARRVDVVSRPLYPRYLFVAFDPSSKGWRAINSTLGVSNIISVGDKPAEIDVTIVNAIRGLENSEGVVELDPLSDLLPGDQVEVVEGAFTTRMGLYQGLSDSQRVIILLDMLGQKVRVALDRNAIEIAKN